MISDFLIICFSVARPRGRQHITSCPKTVLWSVKARCSHYAPSKSCVEFHLANEKRKFSIIAKLTHVNGTITLNFIKNYSRHYCSISLCCVLRMLLCINCGIHLSMTDPLSNGNMTIVNLSHQSTTISPVYLSAVGFFSYMYDVSKTVFKIYFIIN